MNLNDLRKSPLFEGLSDEELKQLMDMAEPVSLRAGEVLIRQGETGDAAYVVIRGEFEVQKQAGQSLIKIDVRRPGDVLGEMALLSRIPPSATVISKTDSEVLRIPQEAFEKLLLSSPTAAMTVMHWVMARLSQNEALLHQQEKMAALGTLSAGLAHELNNPAAAAQRSASELGKTLMKWQVLTHQLEARIFKENLSDWLDRLMEECSRRLASPAKLETLERINGSIWWISFRPGWMRTEWRLPGSLHRPWSISAGTLDRSRISRMSSKRIRRYLSFRCNGLVPAA
jgi:CRP-like cAMP-binding protein